MKIQLTYSEVQDALKDGYISPLNHDCKSQLDAVSVVLESDVEIADVQGHVNQNISVLRAELLFCTIKNRVRSGAVSIWKNLSLTARLLSGHSVTIDIPLYRTDLQSLTLRDCIDEKVSEYVNHQKIVL